MNKEKMIKKIVETGVSFGMGATVALAAPVPRDAGIFMKVCVRVAETGLAMALAKMATKELNKVIDEAFALYEAVAEQ